MIISAVTKRSLLVGLAIFLCGLLLGTVSTMLYAANQIDQLYIERDTLLSEISESNRTIELLEKSLTERRTRVVRSIRIESDTRDQHLNLKLTNTARELIEDLIGTEITAIDPLLVTAVLDNRVVSIEDDHYTLHLKHLIISDTVVVYLTVTPGASSISAD